MKTAAALFIVSAGILSGFGDAGACGNAVIAATDKTVAGLKAAEKTLDDGEPAKAFDHVQTLVRDLEYGYPRESTAHSQLLLNRALRIAALAAFRVDGAVALRPGGGKDAASRRRTLDWATNIVLALQAMKKDSPLAETDKGEVLEREKPAEAKKLLEDLAVRDVIATAYGYAALARLRDAAGDKKGRDESVAFCKKMAVVPAICSLSPKAKS